MRSRRTLKTPDLENLDPILNNPDPIRPIHENLIQDPE